MLTFPRNKLSSLDNKTTFLPKKYSKNTKTLEILSLYLDLEKFLFIVFIVFRAGFATCTWTLDSTLFIRKAIPVLGLKKQLLFTLLRRELINDRVQEVPERDRKDALTRVLVF